MGAHSTLCACSAPGTGHRAQNLIAVAAVKLKKIIISSQRPTIKNNKIKEPRCWVCLRAQATAYKPDVVLLMCGTNDLWYRPSTKNPWLGGNVSQVTDRISLLLERLCVNNVTAPLLCNGMGEPLRVTTACA